jgi:hypothetical protein
MRPEHIDDVLIAIVAERQPIGRKSLYFEFGKRSADSRTERAVEEHLRQLVATQTLARRGTPPASKYVLGPNAQRTNGHGARNGHVEQVHRPAPAVETQVDAQLHAAQALELAPPADTTAAASAERSEARATVETLAHDLVETIVAQVAATMRTALTTRMHDLIAELARAHADADEALRLADEREQQLIAYRTRLKALLDEGS